MLKIVSFEDKSLRVTGDASKLEYRGEHQDSIVKGSFIRKAVPPPRLCKEFDLEMVVGKLESSHEE